MLRWLSFIFFIVCVPLQALCVETGSGIARVITSRFHRLGTATSQTICRVILLESARRRMDPLLVLAIIAHESRYNPFRRGTHGEIGLMQIKPQTARWLAAKFRHPEWARTGALKDPVVNVEVGVAYLSLLERRFRRPRLYLAAYNSGASNVLRQLKRRSVPRPYARAVLRNYVQFGREGERI